MSRKISSPADVFSEKFKKHLEFKLFFKPGEKILLACSGGPDSTALVYLLSGFAIKNDWQLGIIHFNHRLRAASNDDERFVRRLARKLKLDFFCGSGDVTREAKKTGASIEEAARKMRYDFFLKAAKRLKARKIALAHTLDDQAETVLMRILQGTGLRGLQGIREQYQIGRVLFVRPLLGFSKKEILEFLGIQKIRFREDTSNRSVKFLRNRIRLKLLPMLRRDFNPRVTESLARIPSIASREIAFLDGLETTAWRSAVKRASARKVEFRREVFLKLEAPLQFRVIERAIKKIHNQSGLSYDAWERIGRGLTKSRNRWSLPKDIDLVLTPKTVTVYSKRPR